MPSSVKAQLPAAAKLQLKRVLCNDFQPVKVKKIKCPSKRIHKSVVSPNMYNVLEHYNPELKETDSQHVGLGYEVFKKNILESPWKTVVKSKRDRNNMCSKSELNSLKKFETRNPFGLLKNISEENADSILKRLNEFEFIQTLKKADIKKCHSCNYKKRLCMIERSSCPAVDKMCVLCKRTGHFPKSLQCKKYRGMNRNKKCKNNRQSALNEHFIKSNENENGQETVLNKSRCFKCFVTHTPYQKFCRWAKSSEKKTKILSGITEELKIVIKRHIERIEGSEHRWEDFIIDAVSPNTEFESQFPDLVLENNRKLKGGAKEETIKQFISKTDKYNTVLNVLRSSKIF